MVRRWESRRGCQQLANSNAQTISLILPRLTSLEFDTDGLVVCRVG